MDKKVLYSILGVIVAIIIIVGGAYAYQQANTDDGTVDNTTGDTSEQTDQTDDPTVDTTSYQSEKGTAITVTSPIRGSQISSPLNITGNVPGSWSQEGQFSVRLLDSNSSILAEGNATLDGDWMTESPVPFSAELEFEAPEAGSSGLLVLIKANPSDLEENADSLTIPIQF